MLWEGYSYRMKNKVQYLAKKYEIILIFVCVIVLQLTVAAFYMNSKQFMHCDELFCYEGAHNALLYRFGEPEFYLYSDEEWWNTWHSKDEFMARLEVRGDESILQHSLTELKSSLKTSNIYYILLNIVESFQSDPTMTKWSGFVLNSIFFVFHQIMLYLIGWEIFQDKKKALLPMILYGFSAGGITLIVFIRFYLLKSLLCLLIAYIHMRLLEWRNIWGIMAAYGVTGIAVLLIWGNQPYIVLYAASVVFVFMIVCLIKKDYKFLRKYVCVGCAAVLAVLLFVPNIMNQLLNYVTSWYGRSAIKNLLKKSMREYAAYIKFYFMKTLAHTAGGVYSITAIGVMLAAIWYIQNSKEKVQWKRSEYFDFKGFFIIGVSICYFLITCRIQFAMWYRYMSCIYAGICVGIAILLDWVLEICRVRLRGVVVCAVVLIGLFFGYTKGYVDEIYPEASKMYEELAQYPNADNLFVAPRDAWGAEYPQEAYMTNEGTRIYRMDSEAIEDTDYGFLDELQGEGFLCRFPIQWSDEFTKYEMEQILVHTNYKEFERVFSTYYSNVYYVY